MMTVRPSTILWAVLWAAAAFGLYMVKYKVQSVRVEVATAEKQLREERKNLHVLTAEWTFLNRPERLRQLSTKYLDVKPMNGQQLADFASLPMVSPAGGPVKQASGDGPLAVPGVTLASGVLHDE